jgi:hypothetical protein
MEEVHEDSNTDVRNCSYNSRIYLKHQKGYHLLVNRITTFPCCPERNHPISDHIECLTVKKFAVEQIFQEMLKNKEI